MLLTAEYATDFTQNVSRETNYLWALKSVLILQLLLKIHPLRSAPMGLLRVVQYCSQDPVATVGDMTPSPNIIKMPG